MTSMRTIWFVADSVSGSTPFMPSTRPWMSVNELVDSLNHCVSAFA